MMPSPGTAYQPPADERGMGVVDLCHAAQGAAVSG